MLKISQALSEGRVSYSKVRAMTRVATLRNEGALLNTVFHGSTQVVERQEALAEEQLRRRRVRILAIADRSVDIAAFRSLASALVRTWHPKLQGRWLDDGCYELRIHCAQ